MSVLGFFKGIIGLFTVLCWLSLVTLVILGKIAIVIGLLGLGLWVFCQILVFLGILPSNPVVMPL